MMYNDSQSHVCNSDFLELCLPPRPPCSGPIAVKAPQLVRVVDSHTEGEPTRVVISGSPDLGRGTLCDQRETFREQFDWFRSAVVNEPRGSDVLVGALLCDPPRKESAAGVIYFNNVGYLNMCGHGTMGLIVTLAHLNMISLGTHQIDTPAGIVEATLDGANRVTLRNVPSYRHAANVAIEVDGIGTVCGDIAWGGNWFFLSEQTEIPLTIQYVDQLTDYARKIRLALDAQGITGAAGGMIDHIELYASSPTADARNFVYCPGGAYDRSPCGTGTSAKLACLAADGKLKPGETWRQESVIGSMFEASYEPHPDGVQPIVSGHAYVTAEATLVLHPDDPFRTGIHA